MRSVSTPADPATASSTGFRFRVQFHVAWLGRLPYAQAWERQRALHAAVAAGEAPATLLLVEHERVITFGRKGGRENLRVSEEELLRRGFDIHACERGGDVTYHGPGQLVGYPIFPVGRRVRDYLRSLEAVLIRVLALHGVSANGSPGYAGVWVGDEKVAAIGVAVQREVAFHGFALNVLTDLSDFATIVPCGIGDRGVTSLERLTGKPVTLAGVIPQVIRAFELEFNPQGDA